MQVADITLIRNVGKRQRSVTTTIAVSIPSEGSMDSLNMVGDLDLLQNLERSLPYI